MHYSQVFTSGIGLEAEYFIPCKTTAIPQMVDARPDTFYQAKAGETLSHSE